MIAIAGPVARDAFPTEKRRADLAQTCPIAQGVENAQRFDQMLQPAVPIKRTARCSCNPGHVKEGAHRVDLQRDARHRAQMEFERNRSALERSRHNVDTKRPA